jgi:hypothetical protein
VAPASKADSTPLAAELLDCDQCLDGGDAELRDQLRRLQQCALRNKHGADARQRHRDLHPLHRIRHDQTDPSPLSRAEGDQTAGQLRRPAVGLRVAEAFGVAHQQRVLSSGAGLLPQNFADGQSFTWHVQRNG